MAYFQLYFTTGAAPRSAHFAVAPTARHLVFSTGGLLRQAHFQVAPAQRRLRFTTGSVPRRAYFRVDRPDAVELGVALSANQEFLLVTLPRDDAQGPYTLQALREGRTAEEVVTRRPVPGMTGWYFPVPEDGIFYLTVSDEDGAVVAQAVALVNRRALRRLAQYRKKFCGCPNPLFEDLCHYNGLAVVLYETSQFAAAQEMLTVLKDMCLCPC
jgi:hypothetical protein